MSMTCSQYSKIFEGSPYVEAEIRGEKVFKYRLTLVSSDALEKAAFTIKTLLTTYPNLIPTFSTDSESLLLEVERNHYLIINERAVCLAPQKRGPKGAIKELKDMGMSENLLKEPVRCSRGHFLEKQRLEFWIQREPSLCPYRSHNEQWPDYLQIDEEKADDLAIFIQDDDELDLLKKIETMEKQILVGEQERRMQKLEIHTHQKTLEKIAKPKVDPVLAGSGVLKITLKIGLRSSCLFLSKQCAYRLTQKFGKDYLLKEGQKQGASILMKCLSVELTKVYSKFQGKFFGKVTGQILAEKGASEVSEGIAKEALLKMSTEALKEGAEKAGEKAIEKGAQKAGEAYAKYIPGVSLACGVGLATYRWYSAEEANGTLYLQMVGEVVSGACAFIPYYGTAASIGIDCILLGSDLYILNNQDTKVDIDIQLDDAYDAFGIPEEKRANLTKNEFDKAYRAQVLLHPDKVEGDFEKEVATTNIKLLNLAKEAIYKEKNWS